MKGTLNSLLITLAAFSLSASFAQAEILAMVNYETKPEQLIRKEGLAIIDVDPQSPTFAKMLMDIPLLPDLVAHHIFYNRDKSKAYITALGKSVLHVLDLKRFPYRMKAVEVQDCKVLEDVVFSDDNRTWYLTCMGSDNVIMGDATIDKPFKSVAAPASGPSFISHPHGIDVHSDIDRLLVTSTIMPGNLSE